MERLILPSQETGHRNGVRVAPRGPRPGAGWGSWRLAVPAALALAGCAAPPSYIEADHLYYQDRPREVLTAYGKAQEDGSVNSLVGIDKMLSAAILAMDWAGAEKLAELASSRVNIFLADEKGERDALSFLGREKNKPFKGEPHERAMVDFYLGLLRYRRGEYEGALNCFLSAMSKDRGIYCLPVEKSRARKDSENVETVIYDDDYATFAFFAASSCRHIDEPEEARRYLEKAKKIRPDLAALFDMGMDPQNNVIAVVETGRGPVKIKTGKRGEILGYRRGPTADLLDLRLGGSPLSFAATEDLYAQATTIGGRAVDELNRTKAVRQDAIKAAGLATAVAGGILATAGSGDGHHGSKELQAAGLIALGVGIAAIIFSEAAIDPSADVRSWSLLPDRIYIAVGRAQPGQYEVEIRARGQASDDESQRWTEVPIAEGSNLLWFRLLSSCKGGVYPGNAPRPSEKTTETYSGKES